MYLRLLVCFLTSTFLSLVSYGAEFSSTGRLSNSQVVDDLVVGGLDEVCSASPLFNQHS